MRTFEFTLIVDGLDPFDDHAVTALFDRSQDITVGDRGELAEVSFYLDAADAKAAVLQAIELVETAVTHSRVVRVDDELVALSDVAELVGYDTEAVRLWATGQRGPGGFPPPRGFVGKHQVRVWRWAEVYAWLLEHQSATVADEPEPIPSHVVDEVNANHLSRQSKAHAQRIVAFHTRSNYASSPASWPVYFAGKGLAERDVFDVDLGRAQVQA